MEGHSSGIGGLARDILQLRKRLQTSETSLDEKDLEIRALHIALRYLTLILDAQLSQNWTNINLPT